MKDITDIVLINPNYTKSENKKFIFHLPVQCYPPLGLAYLASSLENSGFSSEIIDARALNLSDSSVILKLKRIEPNFVGIYVNSFALPQVYSLIKKIKENTDSIVLVGGPHITYYPSSVIKLNADFGFIGDSERSLVNFLKYYYNKRSVSNVKGLVFKKNGILVANERDVIENLDLLPFPARYKLPQDRYYSPLSKGKMTTMITSRGCVYDCIFCAIPNKKRYRERSPVNVIEEIEEIVDLGIEHIEFEDDCFTLNKARAKKICKMMIENNIKINWGCETRADAVDYETLKLMKKAGCTNIRYGIEAGSDRVRNNVIGKKISDRIIKKSIGLTKKMGLTTITYFMFGNPTETVDEMKRTIKFVKEIDPDLVDFHLPIPIPGSRLFDVAVREKKIHKDIWDKVIVDGDIPVYTPDYLSLNTLSKFQKVAYKRFYLNFPKIIKMFLNLKYPRDLLIKFNSGLTVLNNLI